MVTIPYYPLTTADYLAFDRAMQQALDDDAWYARLRVDEEKYEEQPSDTNVTLVHVVERTIGLRVRYGIHVEGLDLAATGELVMTEEQFEALIDENEHAGIAIHCWGKEPPK